MALSPNMKKNGNLSFDEIQSTLERVWYSYSNETDCEVCGTWDVADSSIIIGAVPIAKGKAITTQANVLMVALPNRNGISRDVAYTGNLAWMMYHPVKRGKQYWKQHTTPESLTL